MRFFPFFILALAVFGCGTHSGNPDLRSGTSAPLVKFGPLVADLCQVGVRCVGASLNKCGYATSELVGLPDALGAPAGKYPNSNDLLIGLGKKEVMVSASAHDACKASLQELACDNALVTGAFANGNTVFDKIDVLLGANALCGRVIETP